MASYGHVSFVVDACHNKSGQIWFGSLQVAFRLVIQIDAHRLWFPIGVRYGSPPTPKASIQKRHALVRLEVDRR